MITHILTSASADPTNHTWEQRCKLLWLSLCIRLLTAEI